jgi:uncharacterized repeat protein (TIGR02543 family)
VWKNYDGTILETDSNVAAGILPTYDHPTPTKNPTNEHTYSFTGWSPTVTVVSANIEYTAVFTSTPRQYSIVFASNGGSAVSSQTGTYGNSVSQPADPEKEGFRFLGWYSDSGLTNEVEWPYTIQGDATLYAGWVEMVPYELYLSALLSSYDANPFQMIPESMQPGSQLENSSITQLDLTQTVQLSVIPFGGFGQQWNMVLTNLQESEVFFDVISIVDTLSSASILAFNNYLDTNPADTSRYQFSEGIYQVTIDFHDDVMYYVLDYTTSLPFFGPQTVQIALEYNITTLSKVGRVQIGDANAFRYEISEGSYKFGIKYAGIRRAYFEISEDEEGNVEGAIYEYLGIDGTFTSGSCAQFFIDEDYVSVVGNKSDSMMGWTGTINELYAVDEGKLIGYEVRETLSSITYNTLWFNLDDTSGITSIKAETAPLEASNPHLIYVNGSTNVFVITKYGGISTKTLSRRYDIELRSQFFYFMDGEVLTSVEVQVPMLFVQEEKLSSLAADILAANSGVISTFSLNVATTDLNRILNDYDTLIDAFIAQKDNYTVQTILDFVGTAYTH